MKFVIIILIVLLSGCHRVNTFVECRDIVIEITGEICGCEQTMEGGKEDG